MGFPCSVGSQASSFHSIPNSRQILRASSFVTLILFSYLCASHLDCHTSTNADSFQRDSAGAGHSCHRFRLHDRRASCPFSGAVRRSRLPGIVSFHSQLHVLWSNGPRPDSNRRLAERSINSYGALPTELQGHIAHSRGSGCTAATPSA